MKKVVLLFLLLLACPFVNVIAADNDVKGYTIESDKSKKSVSHGCYDDDLGVGNQAICDASSSYKTSSCEAIESTLTRDTPIYMCNPPGESYCMKDSDCKVLGKNACVIKPGSTLRFEEQFSEEADFEDNSTKIGICVSLGGSGEDNAFGQAICNLMNVVTGNAGRAVVGVVVIVVGIMFFLGKVTWSLVLAIALGAGAIFGAPAIVKVVTGKQFTCK